MKDPIALAGFLPAVAAQAREQNLRFSHALASGDTAAEARAGVPR